MFGVPVCSLALLWYLQFASWSTLLVSRRLLWVQTWNGDTETSGGRSVSSQFLIGSARKPLRSPSADLLSCLIDQNCLRPYHALEEERKIGLYTPWSQGWGWGAGAFSLKHSAVWGRPGT